MLYIVWDKISHDGPHVVSTWEIWHVLTFVIVMFRILEFFPLGFLRKSLWGILEEQINSSAWFSTVQILTKIQKAVFKPRVKIRLFWFNQIQKFNFFFGKGPGGKKWSGQCQLDLLLWETPQGLHQEAQGAELQNPEHDDHKRQKHARWEFFFPTRANNTSRSKR